MHLVVPLRRVLSFRPLAVIAGAIFFVVSAALFMASPNERSPYILTFVSYPFGYGLFGYTFIAGSQPMMAENSFYIDQTLMFLGAGSRLSMYFTSIRPLYAFMASLLAPATDILSALALINYLAWALAAYVSWRYTSKVFNDEWAAAIAVVLTAFGLGFVIHVNDYSPHILPFAMYYLGTLVIYESGVWREARPWSTHLAIGAYLAVCSLGYSTGLMLAAAYALVAVKRNRWHHVLGALMLGVSSQYVWTIALNVVNGLASHQWQWINVPYYEQWQMRESLGIWASTLSSPSVAVRTFVDSLLQFGGVECPLLTALAAISWLLQPRSRAQRWFDFALAATPIAVALVYVQITATRGYLVFGISLWIYSTIAGTLATALRAPSTRKIAAVAVVLVFSLQASWSTAYLQGYLIPIKMFYGFTSLTWIRPYVDQWRRTPALSLTDLEPAPVLFGGTATLRAAGAVIAPDPPIPSFTWRFGLVARSTIVAYLALVASVWLGRSRLLMIALGSALIWIVPVGAAQIWPRQPTPVYSTLDSERIRAGDRWRYVVDVGPGFLRAAGDVMARATAVEFMVAPVQAPFAVRITAGGQELAVATAGQHVLRSALTARDVVGLLNASGRIEVELTADHDTRVFGWQRPDLPGRSVRAAQADLSPITALPAFELRLLDARGAAQLVGF